MSQTQQALHRFNPEPHMYEVEFDYRIGRRSRHIVAHMYHEVGEHTYRQSLERVTLNGRDITSMLPLALLREIYDYIVAYRTRSNNCEPFYR